MQKEHTVLGYYGMKNFGDDLFGYAISYASKGRSDTKISLLCPPISGLDESFYVNGRANKYFYEHQSLLGKAVRAYYLNKSLKTKSIIFGGGSVFSSSPSNARDYIDKRAKAIELSALGVSIGPFNNSHDENKMIEFLKKFRYISLRDELSYQMAMSYNLDTKVVKSADLAATLPPCLKTNSGTIKTIAFVPCNFDNNSKASIAYCDAFVKAVIKLKKEINFKVTLLNINYSNHHGDGFLVKYTKNLLQKNDMKVSVLDYSQFSVVGYWHEFSNFNYCVSVRLHGAITSLVNNIDFSLFEYHDKCTAFLNEINCFDRLDEERGPDFGLYDIIYRSLFVKQSEYQRIEYIDKSRINFEEFDW